MLINLVKNALKFTHSGKIQISVAYDSESSLLVGHVQDTGTGIEREDLPKLFSKFGKL